MKLPDAQTSQKILRDGKIEETLENNAQVLSAARRGSREDGQDSSSDSEKDPMIVGDDSGVDDIARILSADLDSLAFFKSNIEDPHLEEGANADAVFDEEEMDDLVMRPTDALIIAAKSSDDAAVLEFHLMEDDPANSDSEEPYRPHHYIHHDVLLPTMPLCSAFTSVTQDDSSAVNLVAVGCFTPGIDVWDVERVNILEPLTTLGGYEMVANVAQDSSSLVAGKGGQRSSKQRSRQNKAKKRTRPCLKPGSHSDAVMSLSWNNVQREYLASGSADCTVKIWDIESAHCASTLTHHCGKVQSVLWHPREEATLLTAAFDRAVYIVDVRASNEKPHPTWLLQSDVEVCVWGQNTLDNYVFVSTEDGCVSIFDRRRSSVASDQSTVSRWKAHKEAVSACDLSHEVPGMLITGSTDKSIKVWDVRPCVHAGNEAELVYARPSRVGAVFCAALCPVRRGMEGSSCASPFTLAFGGAKGVLGVADLAVESEEVRTRFRDSLSDSVVSAIENRASRSRRRDLSKANTTMKGFDPDLESGGHSSSRDDSMSEQESDRSSVSSDQ